jgi:hypothetical protein
MSLVYKIRQKKIRNLKWLLKKNFSRVVKFFIEFFWDFA